MGVDLPTKLNKVVDAVLGKPLSTTQVKLKYYNKVKKKAYDYINPDFKFKTEELKYTDKDTSYQYRVIFNKIRRSALYNIK